MNANQQAKVEGSGNIIVQAAGDGIHVNVGLPHLTLIPPRNRVMQTRTEIDLLNPYRRTFDLVGREADMQSLWAWLHSPRPIAIRTLTGRAGAGKTRIAIELIEQLNEKESGHWSAGFVQGRELRRFAAQQNLADWGWARPTLIVVDYAASLLEPLRDWLRDLAQSAARTNGRPLRLLLLEREAAAGDGWLQSLCRGGQSEAGVPELFDPLEPKRLDRLETVAQRREVLANMVEAAASLAQRKPPRLPEAGENVRLDRQLENAVWEDPLYLMMAALLSLHSDLVEVLELPRTELALKLVDHEIKRLTESSPSREADRLLLHLAAFAALGNGLSQEQALAVAEQECAALKLVYPGGVGALVSRVHEVLPAPDQGLTAVVPDILAEALVLRALGECSAAQQNAAIRRARENLGPRVVPFIVRTVEDFTPTGRAEPLNWLEGLIKAGLADDLGLLMEIESAMPQRTLALREKAVEVDELLAERSGNLARENPTESNLAEHSRFLRNLSVRLSHLGRREEALAKAQEAVRGCEQLAQARPNAFLPDLAASLNNLAIILSALGRREEALAKAQEALRTYEHLAQHRHDAFLPDVAMSLSNLAHRLSESGQWVEALVKAQEAVRIREQLAEARPDAFLPDLASSLDTLAITLGGLGRREEALAKAKEAVRIYEQLAQARPDAFLPDLAMSLNNLANRLNELGRSDEALARVQESVRIREQLAQARPDAFLPDVADSMNTLAITLGALGRGDEALARVQESVRIHAQLSLTRPDTFLPALASSLNTLAITLGGLGRREEGLAKAQEASRIREQLAQARPDAFLPDVAESLNTLAIRLINLGRREEALAKAQEAVRIRKQLAQARPEVFQTDWARSLAVQGYMLAMLGRHTEAIPLFVDAIRLLTPALEALPQVFVSLMETNVELYRRSVKQTQQEADTALLAPVLEVFEKLKQNQPKE